MKKVVALFISSFLLLSGCSTDHDTIISTNNGGTGGIGSIGGNTNTGNNGNTSSGGITDLNSYNPPTTNLSFINNNTLVLGAVIEGSNFQYRVGVNGMIVTVSSTGRTNLPSWNGAALSNCSVTGGFNLYYCLVLNNGENRWGCFIGYNAQSFNSIVTSGFNAVCQNAVKGYFSVGNQPTGGWEHGLDSAMDQVFTDLETYYSAQH